MFVSGDLSTCSHVFLRRDGVKKSLKPPYEGPFPVLKRSEKNFVIKVGERVTTVNIDRVKPAFLCSGDELSSPGETTVTPEVPPLQMEAPVKEGITTRSGRRVKFNPRYLQK
jgi:hypothetical protein